MWDHKIRLYAADVSALYDDALFEKALQILDGERRARTERIKNREGQCLCAGAGLLMKHALSEAGCERFNIISGANGKPYIEGRKDLFFNLSHSGKMVICALAPCEVGCDIERIRPSVSRIAGRYFTEEEQEFSAHSQKNFFRMWTLKESFLKVTGKGLSLPLNSFNISVKDNEITISQSVDSRSYSFKEYYGFDGYCCSVCAADADGNSFEEDVRTCNIHNLIR